MAPPGRVLIAHPNPLARAYLRGLAEDRLRLVGTVETDSFESLLAQLREAPGIELVIVDLDLPGMSGEVGLRDLAAHHHGVRLAVLSSGFDQDELDALATDGISALIPGQLSEAALVEMLGRILAGAGRLPYSAVPGHRTEAPLLDHELTSRQCDVLRLLSQGRSNREIAQKLGIAEGTVKVHVNAAFQVLGAHNRVSAAVAFRQYSGTR